MASTAAIYTILLRSGGPYVNTIKALSPLAFWSASTGVYSDTGGTLPVTDGQAVAAWHDLSGNGYHVTQGTAGDRPIYRASVATLNGQPGVEFVTTDTLTRDVANGIVAQLNDYVMICVFRTTSFGTPYMYSEGDTVGGVQFAAIRTNNNAVALFHRGTGGDANPEAGMTAANGNAHIVTARRTAQNAWDVRLDGASVATSSTNITATAATRICIGALQRAAIGSPWVGHISDIILFNNNTKYADAERILAARYGIPLA